MHATRDIYKFSKKLLLFLICHAIIQQQTQHSSKLLAGGAIALTEDVPPPPQPPAAATATPATAATPPARLPPTPVKLNKCCRHGEYLDAMQACVAGSSELWVPQIFLILRRTYYAPKGRSPKFMTFEENVRPIKKQQQQDANDTAAGCSADELEYFTGSGNLILFSNGSLFLHERAQLIEPSRYCVDRESALVCFPKDKLAQPRLKLRKCCGKFGSYDAAKKSCLSAPEHEAKLRLPLAARAYHTLYGFPTCREASTAYAIAGDWHEAQLNHETGELQLHHKQLSTTDYCLEHLRAADSNKDNNDSAATAVKVFTCLHHFAPEPPANAMAPTSNNSDKLQVAALNIGLVISVVFLAATLIAGCMMPSVHHVLHWRCQIYYVFCLFIGDLLLAYSQLSHSLQLGSPLCLLLASAMHFFFLSAFFWLNTMCFNIWWTFRDFRPSSLERNQELLRLRLYSAYAWGIPLLIAAFAVCVDQLQDTHLPRPSFGVRSCWFSGEHMPIFTYFFAPIGILLCANIILFVSTTHQLTCGLWKRDDVKSTTEKTALGKVCLKLVVVMGVTWIAEVISWLVGGPHSAWFFTDLINALQGVFIFIVVGCQPQVWTACKRLCCPRSRQEITNTTNGGQHSSSSQGMPSMAACGAEITQNTSVNTTSIGNTTQTKIPMETVC